MDNVGWGEHDFNSYGIIRVLQHPWLDALVVCGTL
jgi:hypothetical protein